MNKYKNKILHRLIPIKAAVLFFLVASYFFSLCFVVLALNNNNSVKLFYIIPYFTQSSLVLNLNEFLSSVEHKCYFEECGKPNSCWSTVTYIVFFSLYQIGPATLFHLLQNTLFYVQHKKEMNTCLGQHVSE